MKKPFDLEAAKRGEPVVTRDGREGKYIRYDEGASEGHRVLVRIAGGGLWSFYESGVFALGIESKEDLFMSSQRLQREVWINVYPDCITAHNDRGNADFCAESGRTACVQVPLDFEEGEGL